MHFLFYVGEKNKVHCKTNNAFSTAFPYDDGTNNRCMHWKTKGRETKNHRRRRSRPLTWLIVTVVVGQHGERYLLVAGVQVGQVGRQVVGERLVVVGHAIPRHRLVIDNASAAIVVVIPEVLAHPAVLVFDDVGQLADNELFLICTAHTTRKYAYHTTILEIRARKRQRAGVIIRPLITTVIFFFRGYYFVQWDGAPRGVDFGSDTHTHTPHP